MSKSLSLMLSAALLFGSAASAAPLARKAMVARDSKVKVTEPVPKLN